MTAFAEVDDVQGRLDFDMSEAERTVCENALEDVSDEARFLGAGWPDPELAPRMVRTLVLRSVTRYMKNLDGLVQSRAGDETIILPDLGEAAGAPYFTAAEQATIRALAGRGEGGVVSVEATAWRTAPGAGETWIRTVGGGTKPFPFNAPTPARPDEW
ncbi:hypothetical protein [Plantactinospora sp. WMMB782]|uniref:hypothetical protein n=1 Tax=Plantactinospora sp. WMMB782 TaxID=3404121 RepID=UPI003B9357DF